MADASRAGLTDSVVIDASVKQITDALLDFESYPEWMSGVDEMEVLERDKKKRGTKVRYKVDAILLKVNYVLAYGYDDKTGRIDLSYVEGDLEDVNSCYEFEPLDDGGTKVTYHYDVRYSIPRALRLPARGLIKQIDKRIMKSALKDLKTRVESL